MQYGADKRFNFFVLNGASGVAAASVYLSGHWKPFTAGDWSVSLHQTFSLRLMPPLSEWPLCMQPVAPDSTLTAFEFVPKREKQCILLESRMVFGLYKLSIVTVLTYIIEETPLSAGGRQGCYYCIPNTV